MSYREEDVNDIHQHENEVADTGEAVSVGGENERDGDNVMREHLPVVLAAFLNVDNQDLLHPKAELSQHVPLHEAGNLAVGPLGPELGEVEVVGRGEVNVLSRRVSQSCDSAPRGLAPLTAPRVQKTE